MGNGTVVAGSRVAVERFPNVLVRYPQLKTLFGEARLVHVSPNIMREQFVRSRNGDSVGLIDVNVVRLASDSSEEKVLAFLKKRRWRGLDTHELLGFFKEHPATLSEGRHLVGLGWKVGGCFPRIYGSRCSPCLGLTDSSKPLFDFYQFAVTPLKSSAG